MRRIIAAAARDSHTLGDAGHPRAHPRRRPRPRLFPLTQHRSKPAVPIGGKYRLIDVPISNCLHADLRRIFVLTQFNSASLNRHVAGAYRMERSRAASSRSWPPSRPRRARPGSRARPTPSARPPATSPSTEADYYLILAGDHLYRMDYARLLDAHLDRHADVTVAALPVDAAGRRRHGHPPLRRPRRHPALRGEAVARAARRHRPQRAAGLDLHARGRRVGRSSPRWASTSSPATCCSICWRAGAAWTSAAS